MKLNKVLVVTLVLILCATYEVSGKPSPTVAAKSYIKTLKKLMKEFSLNVPCLSGIEADLPRRIPKMNENGYYLYFYRDGVITTQVCRYLGTEKCYSLAELETGEKVYENRYEDGYDNIRYDAYHWKVLQTAISNSAFLSGWIKKLYAVKPLSAETEAIHSDVVSCVTSIYKANKALACLKFQRWVPTEGHPMDKAQAAIYKQFEQRFEALRSLVILPPIYVREIQGSQYVPLDQAFEQLRIKYNILRSEVE